MIRKLVLTTAVVGAVLLGLVAQAGAYLLEFTVPAVEVVETVDSPAQFADPGPYPAGVRWAGEEAPIPVTYWYPAVPADQAGSTTTYAFAMSMFGSDTTTALGTFDGEATVGSPPDVSGGPYPLVILSHGFAITSSSYGWLAEHLATHGFIVAAPHHDEVLDPNTLWRSTIQRSRDLVAVMTEIGHQTGTEGELEGLVDLERTAVIGHSYGGYTAQVAGGARLDTDDLGRVCEGVGRNDPILFLCDALLPRLNAMAQAADLPAVPTALWPDWSLPGVDAVVSIAGDAAMFGPRGLAEIEVPTLAIGGTTDTDSPYEWGTRYSYDNVSSEHKIEIGLVGAEHMTFVGECERSRRVLDLVSLGFCADDAWDRSEAHEVVSHFVTAFLLAELGESRDAAAVLSLDRDIANVVSRAEGY